jgi:hypothetical protein
MRTAVALVVALLLLATGCTAPSGRTEPATAPAQPVQAVPEPPSPPTPPPEQANFAFTVQAGNREVPPGEAIDVEDGPVTLTVSFPVAMDRAATEGSLRAGGLPAGTTITWVDDRQVTLRVPPGDSFQVDAAGAPSADGRSAAHPQHRQINRPVLQQIALYSPAELMAGRTQPVATYRLRAHITGLAIDKAGETALIYPADPWRYGSPPALINLATGASTPLPVPDPGAWYGYGAWLPDGRVLLEGGGKILRGSASGFEAVALESLAWSAHLSPDGQTLALWGPGIKGDLVLVDLPSLSPRPLPGPFRRRAADAGETLAWSPDGKLLAGTDCEREDGGPSCSIRIVDLATAKTVRTLGPGRGLIAWLPDGRLAAWRRVEGGESDTETVLLDNTGLELQILGSYGTPSPDGRYLLQNAYKRNYSLADVTTGAKVGWLPPGVPLWDREGRLVVVSPAGP